MINVTVVEITSETCVAHCYQAVLSADQCHVTALTVMGVTVPQSDCSVHNV